MKLVDKLTEPEKIMKTCHFESCDITIGLFQLFLQNQQMKKIFFIVTNHLQVLPQRIEET